MNIYTPPLPHASNIKYLSTGIDIVNIERIEKIFKRFNVKFINKILHEKEIIIFNSIKLHKRKIAYLAKRFAAKEAIAKAVKLGIGNKKSFAFKDIAILNDKNGAPYLYDHKNYENLSNYNISISISDDTPFAVAFALVYIYSKPSPNYR